MRRGQGIAVAAMLAVGLSGCDTIFKDYLRYQAPDDAGVDAAGPAGPYLSPVSTPLAQLPDANLMAVADLTGDGRPEIVVSRVNLVNALQTPASATADPILVYQIGESGEALPVPQRVNCGPLDRVQRLQPFQEAKQKGYIAITAAREIRFLRHDGTQFDCTPSLGTQMLYTDVAVGDMTNDQNDDVLYYAEVGCSGGANTKCMRFLSRKGDVSTLDFNPPFDIGVAYPTYQSRMVFDRLTKKEPFAAMAAARFDGKFQLNYLAASKIVNAYFNFLPSAVSFPSYPGALVTANLDNSGYDDLVLLQTPAPVIGSYSLYVLEGKAEVPGPGTPLPSALGPYRPEGPASYTFAQVRAANLDRQGPDELVLSLSEPPLPPGTPGTTGGAGAIHFLRYTSTPPTGTLQPLAQLDAEGAVAALEVTALEPATGGAPDLIYLRQRSGSALLTVRRANPGFTWP